MSNKKADALAILPPPLQTAENAEQLKSWALVELFGHQRCVGWITVNPPEFPEMIRVDVPRLIKNGEVVRPEHTRYFGRAAIYGVTPIDEETVRKMLPMVSGAPQVAAPWKMQEEY